MHTRTENRGRPRRRKTPNDSNRLREFREKAGLSQQELAAILNVSQVALSQAEITGKGIGEDKWEAAATRFGCDLLTLRGWIKVYKKV